MLGYMEATRSKSVSELPICDWDSALAQCGSEDDYEDTLFLMELLICFYVDSMPRLTRILEITRAWQQNNRNNPFAPISERAKVGFDSRPKNLETVLREDAHAIKGSAANISLWRISKSAENIELPIKLSLGLEGTTDPDARVQVLGEYLDAPATPIVNLVNEFRNLCSYIIGEATSRANAVSPDLISDLPEESLAHYQEKCTLKAFDKEIMKPFADVLSSAKQTAGEQQKENSLPSSRQKNKEKSRSSKSSASDNAPSGNHGPEASTNQINASVRTTTQTNDTPDSAQSVMQSRSLNKYDNKLSDSSRNTVFQIGTMSPNFEHPSTLYRNSTTSAPASDDVKVAVSPHAAEGTTSVQESSPANQDAGLGTDDQEKSCCVII